jgi:hypothetical protein
MTIMGILGYGAGALFGLVILGIILFVVNKILGGIKWVMLFVAILAIVAIYQKFIA